MGRATGKNNKDLGALQLLQGLLGTVGSAGRGLAAGTAGLPGDIESLIRMLPGLNEKTVLPTSEEVSAALPQLPPDYRQPVAEGLGKMGAMTPGQVAKLGGAAKQGALALANRVLIPPRAIAQAGAIRPGKGDNWLTEGKGSIKDFVGSMRTSIADPGMEERFAAMLRHETPARIQGRLEQARATNGWLDGPFSNYLKKDFASENDIVRQLADQGITHGSVEQMLDPNFGPQDLAAYARAARAGAGHIQPKSMASFVPRQMATTEAGKNWENLADTTALPTNKQSMHIDERLANPWADRLGDNDVVHKMAGAEDTDLGVGSIITHFMEAMEDGTLKPEDLKQMGMEKAVRFVHGRNQAKEAAFIDEMMETGRSPAYMGTRVKDGADGSFLTELSLPKELTDDMKKLVRQNEDGTWSALTPSGKVMQRRIRPGEESPLVDVIEDSPEKALLGGMLGHEGRTMKHCVGGYCDEVAGGNTRVISMRGPDGQSHVTMDIQQGITDDVYKQGLKAQDDYTEYADSLDRRDTPLDFMEWLEENRPELLKYGPELFEGPTTPKISQVYGQANSAPKPEYLPLVQDLIKNSGYDIDNTALKNAGMWRHPKTGAIHTKADLIGNPELEDIYASRNIGADGNWNGNNFAAGGLITAGDDDDFSYPGHF